MPGLILGTILRIVEDLDDPYQAKPGLGGMAAYPPNAMAVVCILMEAEARTYRKMVGHLGMNRSPAMKIGLPKIPSKSTIWRACDMIPEPYLRGVHMGIVGDAMVTGSVAEDSTCYSSNRFARWFSTRHDQVRLKRGWVKLHSIIDVSARTVLDYLVIDGYASAIAELWPMLERIEDGTGLFCLDSAYLARKICDAIYDKGMAPRIRSKSNTICKNGGSQAWSDMTKTHRGGLVQFMDEYHQRSIIETVFEAIKRMYGNHLRSCRRARQSQKIAIHVICYSADRKFLQSMPLASITFVSNMDASH